MKDIFHLIECWKKSRSVVDLLDAGYDLNEIRTARSVLDHADVTARREAFRMLREIAEALVSHTLQWQNDIGILQRQIQQGQLRQTACLAYHRRDRFHKNRVGN